MMIVMRVMSLHLAVYDYQTIILRRLKNNVCFPRTNITLGLPNELIRFGFIFAIGSISRYFQKVPE